MSKDNKVIVYHEPYLNNEITLTEKGKNITKEEGLAFNFYKNNYKK